MRDKSVCECITTEGIQIYFLLPHPIFHSSYIKLHIAKDNQLLFAYCRGVGGVRIVHGYSSIIVAKSIGHHFHFFQNVTVGWGKNGIPTIGNHVTLFPGSVIFGNITIGDNVRVAANTVVRTDIPDNSLVYGNPAVIVPNCK